MAKKSKLTFRFHIHYSDTPEEAEVADKKILAVMSAILWSLQKRCGNMIRAFFVSSTNTTTVRALPEILLGLKTQGFRFETLTKDFFPC